MFGTRDQFTYLECANCGTLQITKIPDLTNYYPKGYCSFHLENGIEAPPPLGFKARFIRRLALNYYLNRRNPLGRYIARNKPWISDKIPYYIKENRCRLGISDRAKILDVGSGVGQKLLELRRCGFYNLTGVDPFIDSSIVYSESVQVLKTDVSALTQQFDLAMMHHSLEHVPDPLQTLRAIHRVLKKSRYAIIRIPLVSLAWQKYGVNWVQLDPPRHLFLFTAESFTAIAREAGFAVAEILYDSTAFQYWGSEQYVNGIPLTDKRSFAVNANASMFTLKQIESLEAQAAELNRQGKGDQAAFYLRKC